MMVVLCKNFAIKKTLKDDSFDTARHETGHTSVNAGFKISLSLVKINSKCNNCRQQLIMTSRACNVTSSSTLEGKLFLLKVKVAIHMNFFAFQERKFHKKQYFRIFPVE